MGTQSCSIGAPSAAALGNVSAQRRKTACHFPSLSADGLSAWGMASTRTQHFKQSIMFMHESRLKGEGCLVHCLAGVSRSVTLVVAYIMTVTRLGWSDALAAVKAARPCAAPNVGFQRQLQEFESTQADKFREWLQMEYKDNPFNDEAQIRDLLVKVPKANSDAEETKKESSSQP
uniref:Dual specificity phosphatase 22b n=1 Tax=Takifugu rubripes TaxID=31033 RepID=A0A674P915_TAKRU